MEYQTLADMIEAHKSAIARTVAEEVITRKIPSYSDLPVEQLSALLEPTIEMAIRYVREGDPDVYFDSMRQLGQARLSEGFALADILVIGQILTETVKSLVAHEFQGTPQARYSADFQQRLDTIRALMLNRVVTAQPPSDSAPD